MNSFRKMALQYTFPLYTHICAVSCVSQTRLNFTFQNPLNHANSDSSPFNSDESVSDDDLPHKPLTPLTTSNYDCTAPSSNDSSPITLYENSPFKQIIKTPRTDISIDRSRHPSHDQSNLLPPPIDRTTKTHYNLRHQPQMEYRLFIPPSKL